MYVCVCAITRFWHLLCCVDNVSAVRYNGQQWNPKRASASMWIWHVLSRFILDNVRLITHESCICKQELLPVHAGQLPSEEEGGEAGRGSEDGHHNLRRPPHALPVPRHWRYAGCLEFSPQQRLLLVVAKPYTYTQRLTKHMQSSSPGKRTNGTDGMFCAPVVV